jgi:hypothetical protein
VGFVGVLPAIALCVFGVSSAGVFWLWLWPQVDQSVVGLVAGRRELRGVLLVSVLLSFCLVASLVRVAMLAFDHISTDLRLLLATAPLTPATRSLVQVVPDFLASATVSVAFGSVGLVVLGVSGAGFSVAEAIAWAIAVVAVVGCFSSLLEFGFTKLVRHNLTARGGAAIATMLLLCGAMVFVVRSVATDLTTGWAASVGTSLLALPAWASVLLALVAFLAAMALWCLSAVLTVKEIFRSVGGRPWLVSTSGRPFVTSALGFLRDAGNRLGFVSLCAIVAFAVWTERSTNYPLGGLAALWGTTLFVSLAAILVYGDYLTVRWRFVVAPSDQRVVLLQWFLGHVGAALLLAGVAGGLLFTVQPRLLSSWSAADYAKVLTALFIGIGAGLVAGRLVPYRKEDVFTIAGSGIAAAVCAAASWWITARVATLATIPQMVPALVLLVILLLAVVGGEAPGWRTRVREGSTPWQTVG